MSRNTLGDRNSSSLWRNCANLLRLFLVVPVITSILLLSVTSAHSQEKTGASKQPVSELAKLREAFIIATKEYKASLERLAAIHERNILQAESHLGQSKELYSQGLISKNQLKQSEAAVGAANDKVAETRRQMATADTHIAETLVEAQAESQMARTPLRRGRLLSPTSYIRYNGPTNWVLPDAWKVQRFFQDTFKKPLPVAVFGQGAIHDRWRLDHRNAMDISLHPDGVEGQALVNFLRTNGIPFLAFRAAIPGTATGPHIHIGRPSHRD